MGQKDITEKHLEDYNDVFADLVNVLLFQGKHLVKEKELEDTGQRTQYKADKVSNAIHEQERDNSKYWIQKHVRICFLGLENQTAVDEDISLRVMGYDGAAYRSQLLKQADGEYLKERYPVITLVLYFGMNHWNKPKSLLERLTVPEELKDYVQDYVVNIFEIAWLKEEQVELFQSDFRIVADYFVQMRKNKNYQPSKETIKHVDEVLKLMSVLTDDSRFWEIQNEYNLEGDATMCEVLDRAIEKGEVIGIKKGEAIGIKKGEAIGITKKIVDLVQKKLTKGKSIPVIADELEESVETIERIIKENELQ